MSKIVTMSDIKVQQHSRELELMTERMSAFDVRIKDAEIDKQDIERLKDVYEKNDDLIKKINQEIENKKNDLLSLNHKISDLEFKIKEIEQKISSNQLTFTSIWAFIEDLRSQVKNGDNSLNSNISSSIESINKRIDSKHEELMKNLHVSPKDIIKDNEELKAKMDSALISAENSMIKCNVHAMNIKLLEKKVENLSLQIKEFELSKKL